MNKIGPLYKVEIKKILKKKAVLISLLVNVLFVGLLIFTYISSDGHMNYIYQQREVLGALSGQKLDDAFFENYHNTVYNHLKEHSGQYASLLEYDPGTAYQNASDTVHMKDLFDFFFNVTRCRPDISNLDAATFQEKMRENIAADSIDFGATAEETDSWLEEYDSIEQPITYAYALGYSNILNELFVIGWALFIVIAISLSGVFADEKANRTDAILLSTRKGRLPLCFAKLLAGITVALIETVILLGTPCVVILSIYGFSGSNALIQNIIPSSAWSITIGKMMWIYVLLAFLTSILFALSNMLLSHITKSSVLTMAIHTALLFVGLFNVPASFGWISKMWKVEPTMALHYGTFLNTYRYGALNNVQFSVIYYLALAVVCAGIIVLTYRKSQVESR